MKRRYLVFFIFLPLILSVAVFSFWSNLKMTFVEWTLKEYCKKTLGYKMRFEKMTLLKDGIIYIEGLSLKPYHPDSFSVGILTSSEAYLKTHFDWQTKSFDSQIHLQNFHLNIENSSLHIPSETIAGSKPYRGFFIHPSLLLSGQGEVLWDSQTAPLELELDVSEEITGAAGVGPLRIEIAGSQVIFKGEDLQASRIFGLAKKFFPERIPFEVSQGVVSGAFVLQNGGFLGALEGTDLHLSHTTYSLSAPFAKLTIDQKKGEVKFGGASLKRGPYEITDLFAGLEFDHDKWHLKSRGKCSKMTLLADLELSGGDFKEGSIITLDSSDLSGEISLNGREACVLLSGSGPFQGLPLDIKRFEVKGEITEADTGLKGEGRLICIDGSANLQTLNFHLLTDNQLSIRSASFIGENLFFASSEKCLFGNQKIAFTGKGDFLGQYNGSEWSISGKECRLSAEGDDWKLRVASPSACDLTYDFEQKDFQISGDIAGGVFDYLPGGLKLEEIAGSFQGNSNNIVFDINQAFSGLVKMGGEVAARFHPFIEIEIYQHTLQGKVPEIKKILQSFGVASSLFSAPLTGDISYQDSGAFFKWDENTGKIQGTIGASLKNGCLDYSDYDIILNDLSLELVYDIASDFMEIQSGRGSFVLEEEEDLDFVIDRFVFQESREEFVNFDCWCGTKKRDKIRLCGRCLQDKEAIHLNFDSEATHFGALYPDIFVMAFDKNGSLKNWDLEMNFALEEVKSDLNLLLKNRMIPFHQNLQMLLHKSDLTKGDFGMAVKYDAREQLATYRIIGKELEIGSWPVNQFKFLGSLLHGQWKIEQCELDDLSIAADLALDDDGYRVSFLGCRLGNVSLIGMDGKFYPHLNKVEANLNLVEINLAELKKIVPLQSFVNKYQLKGEARANSGRLNIELGDKEWNIDCFFTASLKNFSLQGIPFYDTENIFVQFQTDKSLMIKNIVSRKKGNENALLLELENADFDLSRNEVKIQGLHFQIPHFRKGQAVSAIRNFYTGSMRTSLANLLDQINPEDSLEGVLNYELNPLSSLLSVKFSDGIYEFLDKTFYFEDLHFLKKDQEIEIRAQCFAFENWLNLKTNFLGKAFPQGVLEICLRESSQDPPLKIWWNKQMDKKLEIEKIKGTLGGLDFDLLPQDRGLKGEVKNENFLAELEVLDSRLICQKANGTIFSGSFTCPYAQAAYDKKKWMLNIPKVHFRGLKIGRFSGWKEFFDDSFVIDELELSDIYGPLEHLNQLCCEGKASFSSEEKPKRMFPFVKEKIKNIGVLKPSSGSLEFRLEGGKFILTRTRNIIDERNLFRYTLPPSYKNAIGIDGSVSLLFNLVPLSPKVRVEDLISVFIEGTVASPKFSLKRTTELTHITDE